MTSKNEPQAIISAEKQFLFRDAYNRGFIQLPRMVAACICLSANARTVYGAISMFVFEQGRMAFPSVHRMAIMCDMTAKSVIKYIKELEDKGFIRKVRRGNRKTNDYYIVDVHEIKTLRVSEMVWEVLTEVVGALGEHAWEDVGGAWKKLLNSFKGKGIDLTLLECDEETKESLKNDITAILEGGEPVLNYRLINKPNLTKTAGVDNLAPTDKKGNSYLERHESEWRSDNFRFYFYDKYRESTGRRHTEDTTVHRTILSRLLKKLDSDKTELRRYIDAFFEIGYDNPTMEHLGTSGRYAEIELYLQEGKKPFYIEAKDKKAKEQEAEQQYLGMDEDEFLNSILGGKQ